jgi:hypothetical protein
MGFSYFYVMMQSNLIECFVYAFLYHFLSKGRVHWLKSFAVTTFANGITHPIVFFGFMASGLSYFWAVLWAEGFAIVAEAFAHKGALGRQVSLSQTFVASFVANLVSWQLGPLLTYFVLHF